MKQEEIILSPAYVHMAVTRDLIHNYKQTATSTVSNGDSLFAHPIGNISFKLDHGYVFFNPMLHVPWSKSHIGLSTT